MKRKTTFLAILLAATFLLFAGAGCDDPVDPRDHATAGRLRGRVVTGADPFLEAEIDHHLLVEVSEVD